MKLFEVKANRKLLEININKNSVRSPIVDIEEFEHQSLTFQEAVRHVRREMGSNHYGNFIHSKPVQPNAACAGAMTVWGFMLPTGKPTIQVNLRLIARRELSEKVIVKLRIIIKEEYDQCLSDLAAGKIKPL